MYDELMIPWPYFVSKSLLLKQSPTSTLEASVSAQMRSGQIPQPVVCEIGSLLQVAADPHQGPLSKRMSPMSEVHQGLERPLVHQGLERPLVLFSFSLRKIGLRDASQPPLCLGDPREQMGGRFHLSDQIRLEGCPQDLPYLAVLNPSGDSRSHLLISSLSADIKTAGHWNVPLDLPCMQCSHISRVVFGLVPPHATYHLVCAARE